MVSIPLSNSFQQRLEVSYGEYGFKRVHGFML